VSESPTASESAEEAPERFDPYSMHGQMIEAEHLARYSWACQFASGARVLDAGCGMAYGARMLAEAGASQVVGVDLDAAVVAGVSAGTPENVSIESGDVTQLSYEKDSFDLVVCFEVIEHVPEPDRVLDELHRVVRPDGLLVVSTPNRNVYTPGNPHHLRELTPDELGTALQKRFGAVALCRQHTWIGSGVLDDEQFAAADNTVVDGVQLRKVVADQPGEETYTIGLASDGGLPDRRSLMSLTSDVELRRWSEMWHEQKLMIERLHDPRRELHEMRRQLVESEFQLREMAALEARVQELNELLKWYEAMINSLSWRIAEPVRRANGLVKSGRQRLLDRLRREIKAARSR
jgi:SAM-dependent methyltransferase